MAKSKRKTLKVCCLEDDEEVLSVEWSVRAGGIKEYVLPDGSTPMDVVVVIAKGRDTARSRAGMRASLLKAVEWLEEMCTHAKASSGVNGRRC